MANVCKAIEDLKKEAFEEGRRIGLAEIREEESRNIAVRMIKAGKVAFPPAIRHLK